VADIEVPDVHEGDHRHEADSIHQRGEAGVLLRQMNERETIEYVAAKHPPESRETPRALVATRI
jgi:hypothetical protein